MPIAKKTGIRFRMASIDVQIPYDMTDPFNTSYMRTAYNLGYAKMESDSLWKDRPSFTTTPPVAQTAELH